MCWPGPGRTLKQNRVLLLSCSPPSGALPWARGLPGLPGLSATSSCSGVPGLCLLPPLPCAACRHALLAEIWEQLLALLSFLFLKDHCLTLLETECLENCCFIHLSLVYCFVLGCLRWESKSGSCHSILAGSRTSLIIWRYYSTHCCL